MKIFIDPGHGGKDPGAVGNNLQEKDVTLSVSLKLKTLLEKHGIETKLSRSTDTYLTINERYQMANAWGADYFISIHCNAAKGTGSETLYYKVNSKSYAQTIQKSFIEQIGTRDRGVKYRDDLGVIKWTNMPAVLIELAFIDTVNDSKILKEKQDEMAQAIAKGFFYLFGLKEEIEVEKQKRYNKVSELPEWAKEPIQGLIDKSYLSGDENGNLNLSEDMIRMLVIMWRMG